MGQLAKQRLLFIYIYICGQLSGQSCRQRCCFAGQMAMVAREAWLMKESIWTVTGPMLTRCKECRHPIVWDECERFSRVMLYLSSGWGLLMSLRTCYIQSFKKTSWDLVFFGHSLPADDPFDFDVNLIQDDFKQSYYSVILLMIGLPRYMWDMPSP